MLVAAVVVLHSALIFPDKACGFRQFDTIRSYQENPAQIPSKFPSRNDHFARSHIWTIFNTFKRTIFALFLSKR
jgi:hypothetical protein